MHDTPLHCSAGLPASDTICWRYDGGHMDDSIQRLIREHHEQRLERIAKARADAPASKELLDLDFIKHNSRTGALGAMTDEELNLKLEDLYYVDHPRYRTNQELVDLIRLLGTYE